MSFASLLNFKTNIYALEFAQNEETGQQQKQLTLIAENVPCAFQNSGGNLNRNGRISTANNSDRLYILPQEFEIKKHTNIFEVDGVKYNITDIIDMGGRNRYLRINLERVSLND